MNKHLNDGSTLVLYNVLINSKYSKRYLMLIGVRILCVLTIVYRYVSLSPNLTYINHNGALNQFEGYDETIPFHKSKID